MLTSWEEIARYLGASVRTVQECQRRYGMPIHRAPGGKIRISRAELDAWLLKNRSCIHEQKMNQVIADLRRIDEKLIVILGKLEELSREVTGEHYTSLPPDGKAS